MERVREQLSRIPSTLHPNLKGLPLPLAPQSQNLLPSSLLNIYSKNKEISLPAKRVFRETSVSGEFSFCMSGRAYLVPVLFCKDVSL